MCETFQPQCDVEWKNLIAHLKQILIFDAVEEDACPSFLHSDVDATKIAVCEQLERYRRAAALGSYYPYAEIPSIDQ